MCCFRDIEVFCFGAGKSRFGVEMTVVVQKYGGSSVADPERLRGVARRVVATRNQGHDVVVVVSAMGGTTDELIKMANQINPQPQRRELDMLVTVGERISMALLSMAIQRLGHPAISFTGSQSGIITNASHNHARIIEIRPFRVLDELERDRIVIIAGYQGMSYNREITSLGRGGSDTTAVAMAAALEAERCEIYSDVDGVYSADPRVVLSARQLEELSYDEMSVLARHGAVVLNPEAVEFARRQGIALYAKASFGEGGGTIIRRGQKTSDRVVKAVVHKGVWVVEWDNGGLDASAYEFIDESGVTLDYLDQGDGGRLVLDIAGVACPPDVFMDGLMARLNGARVLRDIAMVAVIGEGVTRPEIYGCFMRQTDGARFVFATPVSLGAVVDSDRAEDMVRGLHRECIEVVQTPMK